MLLKKDKNGGWSYRRGGGGRGLSIEEWGERGKGSNRVHTLCL